MTIARYQASAILSLAGALVSELCQSLEYRSRPPAFAMLQGTARPIIAANRL